MNLTYKYRLYPTSQQKKELDSILGLQTWLYNCALEHRIHAYKKDKSISLYDQYTNLPEIREIFPEFAKLPQTLSRGTLQRLDEAFKAFFKRAKKKAKAGFPRFRKRLQSFQFSDMSGLRQIDSFIYFKGITGPLRFNFHRPIIGQIKTACFCKDACGDWWVSFQVKQDKQIKQINPTNEIGIDAGITSLLVTTDSEYIQNIRPNRSKSKQMRTKQRAFARCNRNSRRRIKRKTSVARWHRYVADMRNTYLHQISRDLVNRYDKIVVEKLNLKGLSSGFLAKEFADVGIGYLYNMIAYKAERAGKQFVQIDPKNTTQMCSGCHTLVPKGLKDRIHSCPSCNLVLCRDLNAARNILARG